jgi:2-polyprenyl-3-methyl-5-hydroxy-6-metoxy-1,4-benzoquinol methylase
MLNYDERKKLHGEEYVKYFEKAQSPERLNRLIKYLDLKSNYVIADFACGSGLLLEYVAPKVKHYIGVDFSEIFIKCAKRKKEFLGIKNAEFECSSIQDFCNFNQGSFDVGFAMDFSEHVYEQEWLEILTTIRTSLKENGKLFLHTPNANFFIEIMKSHNFIVKQFPEHVAVRTPEHNIQLLNQAGFSKVKLFLIPHYNVFKYLHLFSYFPIIGKYFKARIFIIAEK